MNTQLQKPSEGRPSYSEEFKRQALEHWKNSGAIRREADPKGAGRGLLILNLAGLRQHDHVGVGAAEDDHLSPPWIDRLRGKAQWGCFTTVDDYLRRDVVSFRRCTEAVGFSFE